MNKKTIVFPMLVLAMNLGSCNVTVFTRHNLKEIDENAFSTVFNNIKTNQYDSDNKITFTNNKSSLRLTESVCTETKVNNILVDKSDITKSVGAYFDKENKSAKFYCNQSNINSSINNELYTAAKDDTYYLLHNNKISGEKTRSLAPTNIQTLLKNDFINGANQLLIKYATGGTDKLRVYGYNFYVDGIFTTKKTRCPFDITGQSYFAKNSLVNFYLPLFKEGEVKYGSNDDKSCSIAMKKTATFKDYYLLFTEAEDNYTYEGNVDVDIFLCFENNFLCQIETKIEYKDVKIVHTAGDKETTSYVMNAHNVISFDQTHGENVKVNVDDYREVIH